MLPTNTLQCLKLSYTEKPCAVLQRSSLTTAALAAWRRRLPTWQQRSQQQQLQQLQKQLRNTITTIKTAAANKVPVQRRRSPPPPVISSPSFLPLSARAFPSIPPFWLCRPVVVPTLLAARCGSLQRRPTQRSCKCLSCILFLPRDFYPSWSVSAAWPAICAVAAEMLNLPLFHMRFLAGLRNRPEPLGAGCRRRARHV